MTLEMKYYVLSDAPKLVWTLSPCTSLHYKDSLSSQKCRHAHFTFICLLKPSCFLTPTIIDPWTPGQGWGVSGGVQIWWPQRADHCPWILDSHKPGRACNLFLSRLAPIEWFQVTSWWLVNTKTKMHTVKWHLIYNSLLRIAPFIVFKLCFHLFFKYYFYSLLKSSFPYPLGLNVPPPPFHLYKPFVVCQTQLQSFFLSQAVLPSSSW